MTDYTLYNWVWIDLDDTLIDFHANSDAALRRVYDEWKLDQLYPDVADWLDEYHKVNDELWSLYNTGAIDQPYLRMERFKRPLVTGGMNETAAESLSKTLDPAYLSYLAMGKKMIPGALELLKRLHERGYKIGVLSNGFKDVQQRKIESVGITDLIDLVVLSDDIGVNKPDVRLYNYAMMKSGDIDPRHHLMIGDNVMTDIKGAVDSEWGAILYNRHGKPIPDEMSGKFEETDDLNTILTFL